MPVRTVSPGALREPAGAVQAGARRRAGNRDITPDAIGPEAVKNLIVTRHLRQARMKRCRPHARRGLSAGRTGARRASKVWSLSNAPCRPRSRTL